MTRVLLAEDDAAISDPLARALVREGYEVTVHEDGREALDSALGTPPDLLVLDEPTVGLDPVLRADLWERFDHLAKGGTTLLVSSHVMDEADHCDELLLMRDGRVLAHTTPHQLREDTGCQSLEEAFLSIIRRGTAARTG